MLIFTFQVQKIDIKYAKSAKRVDVKRLKSTIWNILTSKEKPVSVFVFTRTNKHKIKLLRTAPGTKSSLCQKF